MTRYFEGAHLAVAAVGRHAQARRQPARNERRVSFETAEVLATQILRAADLREESARHWPSSALACQAKPAGSWNRACYERDHDVRTSGVVLGAVGVRYPEYVTRE